MEQKKLRDPIATRLNVLINLALEQSANEHSQSLASRIVWLNEMGVSSPDIADIVNKPTRYVAATLAQRKPKVKSKSKK